MAKIFAKAGRMVVWLGETMASDGQGHKDAITDSDRALEALCRVANSQLTESLDNETDKQAILTML
jgi:hypothetical protein